jgi:hypothetical protein
MLLLLLLLLLLEAQGRDRLTAAPAGAWDTVSAQRGYTGLALQRTVL